MRRALCLVTLGLSQWTLTQWDQHEGLVAPSRVPVGCLGTLWEGLCHQQAHGKWGCGAVAAWSGHRLWPYISSAQAAPWASSNPLGICSPCGRAKSLLIQSRKRRRCHLRACRDQSHTKCAGPAAPLSFSGATCVTAGCASLASFPTILWLLSGKKQLRANIFFLAGAAVRGNSAVKWGMLLFCRHVWQLTSWLGKSRTAQSVPGKGGGWETSGSSKLKISVQAMP